MTPQQLSIGQKVHYVPQVGEPENGIVKTVNPRARLAWVVYKCDGQWDRYRDFTGCCTNLDDLREGWIEQPASAPRPE